MPTRIRPPVWLAAVLCAVLFAGCDAEPFAPVENRSIPAQHPDVPERKHVVLANVDVSPCGNGIVDAGEQCDDGWANANDRECTHACTFNDCDLDEDGTCIRAPVADVDLYPCTQATDSLEGCDLDYGS